MEPLRDNSLTTKGLFVVFPLLGSTLAILYDLGFFYGFDMSYYTIFSLPEHIVFAIQALPIALFTTASTVGVIGVLLPFITTKSGHRRYPKGAFLILAGLAAATGGIAVLAKLYYLVALTVVMVGIAIYMTYATRPHIRVAIVIVVILAISLVFLMGAQDGVDIKRNKPPTSTIVMVDGSKELQGRLVRTGDRGILFYDTTDSMISLVPWNTVKRIQSAK